RVDEDHLTAMPGDGHQPHDRTDRAARLDNVLTRAVGGWGGEEVPIGQFAFAADQEGGAGRVGTDPFGQHSRRLTARKKAGKPSLSPATPRTRPLRRPVPEAPSPPTTPSSPRARRCAWLRPPRRRR